MITVEKALPNQLEAICIIDAMVLGHTNRRQLLQQVVHAGQCFMAKADDVVTGFLVWNTSFFGQGFVSLLIVHPGYRKQGAGAALIKHVETICPSKKLFTSTNLSNKGMQRFCEKMGFQRSGFIENLDEGDPELIYYKQREDW